jgi:hypothetical protein
MPRRFFGRIGESSREIATPTPTKLADFGSDWRIFNPFLAHRLRRDDHVEPARRHHGAHAAAQRLVRAGGDSAPGIKVGSNRKKSDAEVI